MSRLINGRYRLAEQPDPDPLTVPELAVAAAIGRYPRRFRQRPTRHNLLRLAAAFLLGLAIGLSASIVRAAPRSAALVIPSSELALFEPAGLSLGEADRERRTEAPNGTDASPPPPSPSIGMRPAATKAPLPALVRSGIASNMGPGYPATYLALPDGAGVTVRICGAARCVTRTSTDAGPDRAMQRAGRICDLSVTDFEWVSGQPWRRGWASVTLTVLRR